MMNIDFNLIDKKTAHLFSLAIQGIPTENRLVIAVSTTEKKSNGLIIPNLAKEEIPKKGVVIQKGHFTDDFKNYDSDIQIGDVISYGLYAGKQIYPQFDFDIDVGIVSKFDIDTDIISDLEFYVISVQEIIYIEPNN